MPRKKITDDRTPTSGALLADGVIVEQYSERAALLDQLVQATTMDDAERRRVLADARAELAPVIKQAREAISELRALQVEHGAFLTRCQSLDWAAIEQRCMTRDMVHLAYTRAVDALKAALPMKLVSQIERHLAAVDKLDLDYTAGGPLNFPWHFNRVLADLQTAKDAPAAVKRAIDTLTANLETVKNHIAKTPAAGGSYEIAFPRPGQQLADYADFDPRQGR